MSAKPDQSRRFKRERGVRAMAGKLRSRWEPMSPARRWSVVVLLCVVLGFLCVMLWRSGRAHLQSVAVLKQLSGEQLSLMMRQVATQPITESSRTFDTPVGPVRAHLYTPTLHPDAPGMVVFHGVHHLGMDEPRLVAFARAIAGCGIRVLTPELPDIKDYRVSEKSIKVIGWSTVWFSHQVKASVGVLGLSFSGGLSLVAAADATFRPSMKFVFAVGSQGAMGRVATYYRTNEDPQPNGQVELLPAHEYGPLVMEYEHLDTFVPKQDLNAIRDVLRAHLYEDVAAEKAALEKLNSEQKTEVTQLMNASSETTRSLLKEAEEKYADEMVQLSPERDLPKLTVPVYLLHGEADNIIPAAETMWMAKQLKAATLQAALISPVLSHLDMSQKPGAWDEWKLVHFMALVLEAAEKK